MGAIEDVRKVIQDLVTPDLKALSARLDSLEKAMDSRFMSMEKAFDSRFVSVEKTFDAKLEKLDAKLDAVEKTLGARMDGFESKLVAVEKTLSARMDGFDAKLDAVDAGSKMRDELLMLRMENLSNKFDTVHASILNALSIERRLDAIERDRQPQLAPAA